MYNRLKKIIIVITVAVIAILGTIFINAHKSDIFGGYREVIMVDKSTVDFSQVLNDYVKEHHLVMAKRIVEASHDGSGNLKNTYVPIGDAQLPTVFPVQHDPTLIKNSPDNTLYVIVSNHMSASQVAQELSAKHNMVRVLPTNYELSLLYYALKVPQSLLIILGIVVAYISLVLAEYISNMKEVGIRRISGEGKHSIALKQTYRDSIFIAIIFMIVTIGVAATLFFMNNLSSLTLLIVILPVILWCMLILILNFSLSHIFYYILQHQPIILSIKGKSPVRLIFLVIIITQVIALSSVMYCISGMMSINKELGGLNSGKDEWQKFSQFFEITSLDDRQSVSQQQRIDFLKELNDKTTIIYREDTLDSIATSNIATQVEYAPTAEQISNVIYVNDNYIKYSGLTLSRDTLTFIQHMHDYDK